MKTIGENIAYFRKQKKMTQEELAEQLNVTAQAVSKWECDSSYPDIETMQTLAKILGISVDMLLNGTPELPQTQEGTPETIDRRILLIDVKDDETTVKLRLPVSMFRQMSQNEHFKKMFGGDDNQIKIITDMIDAGLTGPIVDVDTDDEKIMIRVENYEN